jgi:hypothetical protein
MQDEASAALGLHTKHLQKPLVLLLLPPPLP